MAKIDTSGWKEFEVGELFPDIVKPDVLHTRQVVEVEDGIPYVVRTKFNNGIKYRVEKTSDMKLSPAGVITFGAENATFFYQTEAFVSGRDVYYIDTRNLSANTCLFLTACLQPIAKKYSYNNGLFPELLKKEVFLLPVDPHEQPDWASMDRFMAKTMKRSKASLSDLRLSYNGKKLVELREWEEFSFSSLFEIVKGSRLTKSQMKEGDVRFIGSSAFQNGLTAHVANAEKLHPANTITVCYNGSVGETFYQDQPFWASDDVNVLYPKFDMTRSQALFICPLIRAVGKRYAFVNKWKKEEMEKATIKLPTTPMGQPDWNYMETYMSQIWEESQSALLGLGF